MRDQKPAYSTIHNQVRQLKKKEVCNISSAEEEKTPVGSIENVQFNGK